MASANLSLPSGFGNIVRLFPLPNLVLFPGLVQALHIFEPRYRQMMADALDSDQLISLALLQPSANPFAEPIFSTVCIGKIVTHVKLEDGRFNLILAGVCRARVLEELPAQQAYRLASVELPSEISVASAERERELRERLVQLFRQHLTSSGSQLEQNFPGWLDATLPLGQLCDLIAFAGNSNTAAQYSVLDAFDIVQRAERVIAMLEDLLTKDSVEKFPPDFSLN